MDNCPYRGAIPLRLAEQAHFGLPPGSGSYVEEPTSNESGMAYHAFAVANRARPYAFRYEDSEDGIKALANLIRSEEVIKVVYGRAVTVEAASVVSISVGDRNRQHSLSLLGERQNG